jgi:DNA-binding transcriptional LysR family regulator
MKIEYFREFVVLAEYLNFTTAAEHLYITQPVLSRHMAALEAHLDTRLFARSIRSVELTDMGNLFLASIKKILNEYDDLRSLVRMKNQGFADRLCIGVPYYGLHAYLGHFPELFEAEHPEIKLQYIVGDPDDVLNALKQGKADLVLMAGNHFPRAEMFEFHELFREPIGVLISSLDPLAKRESCSLAELSDKLFFSVSDSPYFSELWMHTKSLCQKAGFEPRGPAFLNQVETAFIAVRRGDGVIALSQHLRNQASDEIAYLNLTDRGCERPVNICCKKGKHSDAMGSFISMFSKLREIIFPPPYSFTANRIMQK